MSVVAEAVALELSVTVQRYVPALNWLAASVVVNVVAAVEGVFIVYESPDTKVHAYVYPPEPPDADPVEVGDVSEPAPARVVYVLAGDMIIDRGALPAAPNKAI